MPYKYIILALITARLKTVIKMPASEMLGKVSRYTKSSLKLSLGFTAYSIPRDLARCLSHHSPELCLQHHTVYRHSTAHWLFSSPQCLESVTSIWIKNYFIHIILKNLHISQQKLFFRYLIFSQFLGGLQSLWVSHTCYKSTHGCIVTNDFACPTVHSPVLKEARMPQTVVTPQQLKDNPCSMILGPALNNLSS
jgi:hypothetical protein